MRGLSLEFRLNPDYAEMLSALSALSAEGAEFLIVGAFAVAAYGIPRSTGDIDIWVNPDPANAERVWRALERFGAPLRNLSPSDFTQTDFVFQMGVRPCRIDLMTAISGVDWNEAWSTRLDGAIEGMTLPVLSKELLIRNKRAAARPQDLADADRLEHGLRKGRKR
jgi:hypothetical protein